MLELHTLSICIYISSPQQNIEIVDNRILGFFLSVVHILFTNSKQYNNQISPPHPINSLLTHRSFLGRDTILKAGRKNSVS